jgi:hypothetical protein
MPAKSGSRLLVILLLLAAPFPVRGQVDSQVDRQADDTQRFVGDGDLPAFWLSRPLPQYFPAPRRGPVGILPFRAPVSPQPLGLPQITRAAGTIFSGRVTTIARVPASSKQIEAVAISFHVERAIRGVTSGQSLTIYLWIGSWDGGQRYRVGERVVLFLYPPSKLGLTSTVGGPLGRFSIDSLNRIVLSEQHVAAFAADLAPGRNSHISLPNFIRAARRSLEEE